MDKVYAYKNKNDVLMYSSSGGAYMGIVDILKRNNWGGGEQEETICVIYGARFNKDFKVVHDRAISLDECKAFCGSKYVQSDLGHCFESVIEDLNSGKIVLFTGTPCQAASIKNYVIRKNCSDENLYIVDIACHGVPQPKFWKEYVNLLERKNQSKLVKFCFRYKPRGWKGYPIFAEFSNGKKSENEFETSRYMYLFRKNLLMRESCFQCKYPGNFKSDITIADFWGIELIIPEVPTQNGVSLLLAHTIKGRALVEKLQENSTLLKEMSNDDYLKYNHNLTTHTVKPNIYDVFWKDFQEKGIEYVLKNYSEKNLIGRWKFYIKRFLRDSGILVLGKQVFHKVNHLLK